jgi:3-oxoacyl-[acyl-carrier-protein] synthase-3
MATTIESVAVVTGDALHRSARKLADHAIRDSLDVAGVERRDVDLVVNAGLFHDRVLGEPAMAALIQEDVGLNAEDPHGEGHGTFSFDLANGSAGVLSALQVVDGFLRARTISHAVVVAGDANPGHHMAPEFPYDAAGGSLVCGWDDSDRGIAAFRWATLDDVPARRDAVVRLEGGRNQLLLHEDAAFAAAAARCAAKVATELLAERGLQPDDIAHVAAAPLEAGFIDELVPRLGIPSHRFARPAPERRLHTAGLVAAWAEVAAHPPADGGDWVLLVAAGAGITAGAALIRR